MRLKLGIIPLLSVLQDAVNVENSHYSIISGLKKEFDISFINPEEADSVDLPIIFIGSGGTENYFKDTYSRLSKPVILLTDGMHNSLAASMEILAWIKECGEDSIILHGNIDEITSQINANYEIYMAMKRLNETVIGVVGFPSDWLIASSVDYIDAQKKWGVIFKNIELHEFSQRLEEINIYKAEKMAGDFIDGAASLKEPNNKDVTEGMKVYLALKELIEDYGLDAITVRCFELLLRHHTTGCLALSYLNNEDIVSGCEGDCQAVFSMLLLNILTGGKSFMANPAYIDIEKNNIVLAHCTIPTCLTDSYVIRNHFESHMGVSIQGIMKKGPVTIFKCGGGRLDKYFLASGELLENLEDENMCRTQLKIHLNADTGYFLRNPIANHHILIEGDYVGLIDRFMQYAGCKRIA